MIGSKGVHPPLVTILSSSWQQDKTRENICTFAMVNYAFQQVLGCLPSALPSLRGQPIPTLPCMLQAAQMVNRACTALGFDPQWGLVAWARQSVLLSISGRGGEVRGVLVLEHIKSAQVASICALKPAPAPLVSGQASATTELASCAAQDSVATDPGALWSKRVVQRARHNWSSLHLGLQPANILVTLLSRLHFQGACTYSWRVQLSQ